jgi:hypothetical protein
MTVEFELHFTYCGSLPRDTVKEPGRDIPLKKPNALAVISVSADWK